MSEPRDPLQMHPIGAVENDQHDVARVDWSRQRSVIRLTSGLGDALLGLDGYSHVLVIGWMHEMPQEYRDRRQAYPGGDDRLPLQGALALRGGRPNPISVTVCRLRRVEGDTLEVEGLDLVDGTPILDIKPYIAFYDSVPKASIPQWAGG